MRAERTKAERAADEASEEVRKLQREEAAPALIRAAILRRDKAWRCVQRLRETP